MQVNVLAQFVQGIAYQLEKEIKFESKFTD